MVLATTTRTPDRFLSDAINNALLELAIEAGYTSELDEVDADDNGQPIYQYLPNNADLTRIAREPLTIAALVSDICNRMGVEPPAAITAALTDEPPY